MRLPWRQAWKVLPSWGVLHRVAVVAEYDHKGWNGEPRDLTSILGVTCCGRSGHLLMPGIVSRLGLRRCIACCRGAGVKPGAGIPGNGPDAGPYDAWQERAGVDG